MASLSMTLTLVRGLGQLSALTLRLAPLLSFSDLLEIETVLPEIETALENETTLPEFKTALPKSKFGLMT